MTDKDTTQEYDAPINIDTAHGRSGVDIAGLGIYGIQCAPASRTCFISQHLAPLREYDNRNRKPTLWPPGDSSVNEWLHLFIDFWSHMGYPGHRLESSHRKEGVKAFGEKILNHSLFAQTHGFY